MGELNPTAIAESILKHLPTTTEVEAYVENIGSSSLLLQRDGEGQVPLLRVFDDNTLTLYDESKQDKFHCAIIKGLERTGYKIKFDPISLGSSVLYLIEEMKV